MSTDSQTRVYRGSSVEELIPRIQRELGSDAIILRRREGLTGGILGFFQRSFVEIEAVRGGPRIDMYDEDAGESTARRASGLPLVDVPRASAEPSRAREPASPVSAYPGPSAHGGALTAHGAYVTEQLAALAMVAPPESITRAREVPRRPSEPTGPPSQRHEPQRELDRSPPRRHEPPRAPDLPPFRHQETPKDHVLDSFAAALASAEAESAPTRSSVPREPWSVPPAPHAGRRTGTSVERRLVGFGMSEGFARELIETARAHVLPLASGGGLTRAVRAALAQRIPVAPQLPLAGAAIVVVGAGGSGKTSACAALMRAYRRAGTLPAGYGALTWDPERPGLQVLLSPHVMRPTPIEAQRSQRAMRRVRGEGLLVIDTPRLSPADKAGVHELASLLGEMAAQRVVVALPATLGATAAAQLLEALRPLGANALVVTHADETDQIGVAIEAACAFGLAPEYRLDRNRSGAWRIGRMDPSGLAERLLP